MSKDYLKILGAKTDKENLDKLTCLENPAIIEFIGEYVELCNPKSIFVRTDSEADIAYIKEKTLSLGEEKALNTKGHTYHFDGYKDQARDKKNTRYLLPKNSKIKLTSNKIQVKQSK